MKEISTEEKARVFAMYHGGKVTKRNTVFGFTRTLSHIIQDGESVDLHEVLAYDWVLILRPLSDITDGDAIEVAKLFFINSRLENYDLEITIQAAKNLISDSDWQPKYSISASINQFLISKGYAVRIYPYGKTPIELGIAITATP